jgi:hypothetical protein
MLHYNVLLFATAFVGAAVGLLLGQSGDVFFNVDTGIIGLCLGPSLEAHCLTF